jgi:hypothetical protein
MKSEEAQKLVRGNMVVWIEDQMPGMIIETDAKRGLHILWINGHDGWLIFENSKLIDNG